MERVIRRIVSIKRVKYEVYYNLNMYTTISIWM